MRMKEKKEITLTQLREALLNEHKPLSPSYLYRLSDLSESDLAEIKRFWSDIPIWRKQALFEDLEELAEVDTLLSYEAISSFALQDSDARVRELAIRNLWESELPELVPTFLEMMSNDTSELVRAAAATALGKFVYLGEIDMLPAARLKQIEDRLIETYRGSDSFIVRRRALEALGYSSREEINTFLDDAYHSGNNDLLVSSLFAMGRSANQDWIPLIEPKLYDENPEIRFEAARAAGELEASSCRERLIELIEDPDVDVRMAAVWSLSQIGGEGVREELMDLYNDTDDDDMLMLIEDALENLAFTEDVGFFELIDVESADDEDEFDEFDDEFDSDEDE